jgi:hypothetical protein
MKGVVYDLDAMKQLLLRLVSSYAQDYNICCDQSVGLERKVQDGLKDLQMLGDIVTCSPNLVQPKRSFSGYKTARGEAP